MNVRETASWQAALAAVRRVALGLGRSEPRELSRGCSMCAVLGSRWTVEGMEDSTSPDQLLNEIETRHEITEMLTVGLGVNTVVELLRYQASLLLLCAAVNPYLSDEDDFHPLIALMQLADRLKRVPSGCDLEWSVDPSLLGDDEQCATVADKIIELLRHTHIDANNLFGFDPHDPLGVDFSFNNALAARTEMALDDLPSQLLVAEIGKIVVPALTKLNAQVNNQQDHDPDL